MSINDYTSDAWPLCFFCRYEEMEREISEMKRENARLKSSGEELEAQLLNYRYRCGIPLTLLIINCPISCTRVTSFFRPAWKKDVAFFAGATGKLTQKVKSVLLPKLKP